jgi:nifR3 family TIM-barrel protein
MQEQEERKTVKQIKIRNLIIHPPLLLAPMVGLTHSALRRIICGFGGAGLLSTEMLSARSLPVESPVVSPYLVRTAGEKPLSYQLLISSVPEVRPAIDALHALHADAVDVNLGCPAPAAVRRGAGLKLMEEPEEVRAIVAEARKLTNLPLTAKIRLSDEPDDEKLKDFCRMLQDEGIDMLSVHGRLKKDSFARKPRWESVAGIKDKLSIPVIANGGIFSVDDAARCLRISGADGLMLGRGAASKPWLFASIAREIYGSDCPEPAVSLPEVYNKFIGFLVENFRPEYRLGRLKQFTHYFAQNYQFGHYLASRVQSSNSLDEARERAEVFFADAQKENIAGKGADARSPDIEVPA